jgi:hypothetical protein
VSPIMNFSPNYLSDYKSPDVDSVLFAPSMDSIFESNRQRMQQQEPVPERQSHFVTNVDPNATLKMPAI